MTRRDALASALILAVLLPPPRAAAEALASGRTEVTLYHWWTSPSERAALEALGALFQKEHPGAAFVAREARAHGGGGRMFQVVSAAAGGGRAPEAFQVHAGAPLRPYLDAGLVSPVDDVWQSAGLVTAVPKVIRDMSTLDGRYQALPINVHRNNLVWYNKSVLDQHRIDPAAALAGWDAFFRAADQLRGAGMAAPVQIGESWTASVAFESILAGRGVSAYEDWINGRLTTGDDPRLLEAFSILRQLYAYANADHARTSWDTAIRRVISGEAAFCIMGDWANGEFRLAGKEFGRDYGALPVPGTKGLYGVSVDSFATSRGLLDPAAANRFLRFAAGRGA
jgi:glucose/mannose transport system substrate-binding protein